MAVNLIPPSRQTGTAEQQLNGLYSYLYQLVEALNVGLNNSSGSASGTVRTATQTAVATGNELSDTTSSSYQQLKALIVKTAAEATGSIRKTVAELSQEYMAQSEFGTYEEFLSNKISQGADGVVMEWDAENRITTSVAEFSEYIAESDVYIRVGIVKYNDDGTVEAGVVIGKELTSVTIDGKELITSQNLYALFTAEELSFWQDGVCRARYGMVDFMVEKGYIDEVTTSLLQSETFGAQLILNDTMLAAIAEKINLTANESIQLVVKSTPATELHTGTTVTITDEIFHVNSPETRFSIPSPDSEDGRDIVSIDDEGLTSTVINADTINSTSVVNTHTGGAVTLSSAGAMQVYMADLSGKWLTGDITINASGVTNCVVDLYGVHGYGAITISGGSFSTITVRDCGVRVVLSGVRVDAVSTCVTAYNSNVYLNACTLYGYKGIVADRASNVTAYNNSGSCSVLVDVLSNSTVRFTGYNKPYGYPGSIDGELYSTYGFSYASTPSVPSISTVTLTATNTRTWGGSWLSASTFGNALYQGTTGGGTLRRGCMWFDRSAISGKTIRSATLTMKRYSGIGGGSAITVSIYGTTATSDSGTPAIGTKYASVDMANGATVNVDVTSAVQALANGTIGGLMIYDTRTGVYSGKSYTVGYVKLYGTDTGSAPVLNVTYGG